MNNNTIIADQLNEVLVAAGIKASNPERDNIISVIESCHEKNLSASAAASQICRDMDIDEISTYTTIKKQLIAKGIFKN
jgi:hypothetical protein